MVKVLIVSHGHGLGSKWNLYQKAFADELAILVGRPFLLSVHRAFSFDLETLASYSVVFSFTESSVSKHNHELKDSMKPLIDSTTTKE